MRAYQLRTSANAGKLAAVAEVLPWWQRGLVHVQHLQVRRLRAGELTLGWLGGPEAKALPSYLSARQWKSVVNQTNAALESWRAAAVAGVRELIRDLDIDEEFRVVLYRINLRHGWWCERLILDRKTGAEANPAALRVCRDLIGTWLWRHPFPNLSRVRTMTMDGPIATVEPARGVHADFWVRVSTCAAGRPVRIPLHGYDYFVNALGDVRNFCQVTVNDDGAASFALVKKSAAAPIRVSGESIGVDWGVASMFTTSTGQILGQHLYVWLAERDGEVTALATSLQRQGVKPSESKRFRAFTARIRAHVRNEVGRLLNQLAAQDIRGIVVEKLDFRFGGLSKRLNRILSRAGRAAVTAKLLADINAARNVLGRSAVRGGWLSWSRDRVLAQLDRGFTARWRCDPTLLRERPTRRGRSTATSPPAKSIVVQEQCSSDSDTVHPRFVRPGLAGNRAFA